MRVDAVSLKKSTLFGLLGVLCMLMGGCGGGGSGSSGAVAGVQNVTPGQLAMWTVSLSSYGTSLVYGTGTGGGFDNLVASIIVTPCSSGSRNYSISGNTFTFSDQNCSSIIDRLNVTINGSGSLAVSTSGATPCNGSSYPSSGATNIFSMNNFSESITYRPPVSAVTGQIALEYESLNCSPSSLTVPIKISISSTAPLTGQFPVKSNLNASFSNLQIDEVITFTTPFINNIPQTTLQSLTINSGSFSLNGVTYSFSTPQGPLTVNSSNVPSGGTLVVTGPNETETLVISSSSTGEALVTITKNGTVVANEPLATYMG